MSKKVVLRAAIAAVMLCGVQNAALAQDAEAQSLDELRNTVINLLDALVQKGVMTREQAQAMVQTAQSKAEAAAKVRAEQEAAEKDAVRVTNVPQFVRDEISKQVSAQLKPEVTREVVAQAKAEKWGVPGALPEWVSGIRLYGDMRVRLQQDSQEMTQIPEAGCLVNTDPNTCVIDYQQSNEKGEVVYRNITAERLRERIRLRVGLEAKIADGVTANARLASGSASDPVSTNQTLGMYNGRYALGIDQAYLRFDSGDRKLPWMTVIGGRNPNPFVSTDLVWDPDLSFDGVLATWRIGLGDGGNTPNNTFFTAGAFPLQEIDISSDDKWLYGAQLGLDWSWDDGGRARLAGSYYYFDNITGKRNALDSDLLDYTAPKLMQKGNSVFDIRNVSSGTDDFLWALASEYRLANLTAMLEFPMFGHKLLVSGDYVKNIGYDEEAVRALNSSNNPDGKARTTGYQAEVGFGTGTTGKQGNWRAYLAYKRLERDAVVDAFTDSDFNLGGTDAKGYILRGDWWFRDRTALTLRYLSSDSIDAVPVSVDVAQLDISATF